MTGSFILYDLKKDHYLRYNPVRCKKRFVPAATFHIMLSLIALEKRIIEDENVSFKWNKTQHQIPEWNRNHNLKTAIQHSIGWFYKELAARIGKIEMWNYVSRIGYGNIDISGETDNFWLTGKLRISQAEQIEFLKKLYKNELPFSKQTMHIVKKLLLYKQTSKYKLKAKTGMGSFEGTFIGWFEGYLEQYNNVYFFATNVEDEVAENEELKNTGVEMTKNVLRKFGLL